MLSSRPPDPETNEFSVGRSMSVRYGVPITASCGLRGDAEVCSLRDSSGQRGW